MSDLSSRDLLELYQAGQNAAATELFDRYAERLLSLVRKRLGAKIRRRVDSADIVQSAFRSFFVQAKDRPSQCDEPPNVWGLLAAFTLNKLNGQIERHTAAKRSVAREEPAEFSHPRAAVGDPSVVEAIAAAELLRLAVNSLSDQEHAVLMGTVHGQSPEQIAATIGKSTRTVRRLLAEIERKVERHLLSDQRPAQPTRALPEPIAPLRYADFVLGQLIGRGGMGKVYRATQKSTGETLAIKALHKSRLSDERAVQSFVQEAEILATLSHANIVGIRGLGKFPGGGYFIAMDYVDGVELQTQLQAGQLLFGDTLRIVKQIAGAVQFAHDHGIVHSDLTPRNVLVDKRGRVFVTDFGFAVLTAATTNPGVQRVGGTLGFIAPEVLSGRMRPTPAADVYALGALLEVLVAGASDDRSDKIVKADEEIRAIIRRCMANDPRARYGAAKELIDALTTIQTVLGKK